MVTKGALTQHVEQAQHVQQGSCARFHWHVGHGYSFNPAGVPVDTCEEVTERMRLGKWHNNVYMNVVETEVTDGRACGMRPLCVAGFRLLARDAGWRPPATSRFRPFQTKRALTSLQVDHAPGWARLCIKLKTSRRNDSVTTGLTLLWDASQRSVRLSSSAGGISTSFRIVIPVFKHCVSWSWAWDRAIAWK